MVLDPNTIGVVCFGSILLGTIGRTFLPYIQKLKEAESSEDPKPAFQRHYLWTFIYSVIVSIGISIPLWTTLSPTFTPTSSLILIVLSSASLGYTSNDVINNFVKAGGSSSNKTEPTISKDSLSSKLFVDKQEGKPAEEKKPSDG